MMYGLYLSAAGVLSNQYRQDVLANNLANVHTTAFKRDAIAMSQREPEVVEDQFSPQDSNRLLDQLGGGVLPGKQFTVFDTAPLEKTNGPLDLALENPKAFFSVAEYDAQLGRDRVRLSRDGRFTLNDEGYLVTLAGGNRVLNESDVPIKITGEGEIIIDTQGRITQGGQPVAQLNMSTVNDTSQLIKRGQNLYHWGQHEDLRRPVNEPQVRQGYLENSGVDPIRAMMDISNASRGMSSNARMIGYFDRLMDQAINTLGRIA